jgi:hypothetical protein
MNAQNIFRDVGGTPALPRIDKLRRIYLHIGTPANDRLLFRHIISASVIEPSQLRFQHYLAESSATTRVKHAKCETYQQFLQRAKYTYSTVRA